MTLSTRNTAIAGVALLILVVGAFVAGNVVGDDASEVESLEAELSEVQGDLDDVSSSLRQVEDELDATREERDNLTDQLSAEQNLSGEAPVATDGGQIPDADYVIGAAGNVGEYTMDPALAKASTQDGVTRWVATIVVKNNGSEPAELFCGDYGAELIDSRGRTYGAKSVVAVEGSANCGDAIQPGLTIDDYKMEFSLPADAEPAVLELSGGEYGEGPYKSWAVTE